MKEVLKLDHIKKYYGNGGTITKAIEDISFSVHAGGFVGIMGAVITVIVFRRGKWKNKAIIH